MKNALKEKLKNNVLVKPLYKRLKNGNKIKPSRLISVQNIELDGHGIKVKSGNISHGSEVFKFEHTQNLKKKIFICDTCDDFNTSNIVNNVRRPSINYGFKGHKILNTAANRAVNRDMDIQDKRNKLTQAGVNKHIVHKVPCTWLRVYPLPQSPGESVCSVILRCALCQFGLATFLVMWTIIWIFVIQYFEGPFEKKICHDFKKKQSQLVIDLATELRQTHLSKYFGAVYYWHICRKFIRRK